MSHSSSTGSIETSSAALSALVAQVAGSLVSVHSHRSRSSGFVWKPGLVVTADEALADEGEVSLTLPGGERVAAVIAGRDQTTDVALLRIERTDLPPVTLEAAAVAAAGALALAVGARDGAPVAALGAVAFAGPAWRSLRGGEIDARIELDLVLRGSAEGGLALDAAGRAFGMAVLGPRRRPLVIPAATVERVATRLQVHGRIARGYLGLALQPVATEGGEGGIMVMGVDRHGPGAAAGIHQGDVILAWNGEGVRSGGARVRGLGPDSVGTQAVLSLRRAGASIERHLIIGERAQG